MVRNPMPADASTVIGNRIEPSTVVTHFEHDLVVFLRERNTDLVGLPMPQSVVERFLGNSVQVRGRVIVSDCDRPRYTRSNK